MGITPDDGSEDVFVHVKECPELEGAQPGDAVNYDTKYDDRKGKYNATNLSVSGGGGGGQGWRQRILAMVEWHLHNGSLFNAKSCEVHVFRMLILECVEPVTWPQ